MYVSEREDLMKEWNHEKNISTKPDSITTGSNQKVWWKCSKCGYEWQAKIANRVHGRGCPCCANRTIVKGVNDLTTTHPDLSREWHPEKNGTLTPAEVSAGSGKKVWWRCPMGHEYKATVLHRSSGTNCPICQSGRQTSFSEQAVYFYIKQVYPDAENRCISALDGKTELDIYIPSIKTAIEYDGAFWHKADKKERELRKFSLCREYGIRLIRIKEPNKDQITETADLIFTIENPDDRKKLEILIRAVLDEVDYRSNLWTRKTMSDVHSPVSVDLERDRFQIYEGYLQKQKRDSLAERFPEVASEWHPTKNGTLTPDMFLPGSDEKVWWLCPDCGKEWLASIGHRTTGTGCPSCGKTKNSQGNIQCRIHKNGSLKDTALAVQWNYEKNGEKLPEHFTKHSSAKVWWKCPTCNYEWEAVISNRMNGRGCPCCSNKVIVPGVNDLATRNPALAKEWHPTKNGDLTPDSVAPAANKSVWWLCPLCGHEWKTTVNNRSNGNGCPKCVDRLRGEAYTKQIIKKRGSVADLPLAEEWNTKRNGILKPEDCAKGTNKKVWWTCKKCGYEWEAVISSRTKGSGCPKCAGQVVEKGVNDLASQRPDIAKEWHPEKNGDLTPDSISYRSGQKVWWKCSSCNHEWQTTVSHRTGEKGTGCPLCSKEKLLGSGNKNAKKIYQYSLDGTFLKEWGSLKEAATVLGINSSAIVRCAKHAGKSAGGYRWEYTKE